MQPEPECLGSAVSASPHLPPHAHTHTRQPEAIQTCHSCNSQRLTSVTFICLFIYVFIYALPLQQEHCVHYRVSSLQRAVSLVTQVDALVQAVSGFCASRFWLSKQIELFSQVSARQDVIAL
ncbi:hypothetical protein E2C01_028989 [Portunus trituberculatus]|uniref:Uncharacterized protein n=1 Tax=Portunus trituberculatus TaxID=210409 RepID=A0A5B7ETE6_PORTR|nr:hypothetical protein [Portunus trituberculatus]